MASVRDRPKPRTPAAPQSSAATPESLSQAERIPTRSPAERVRSFLGLSKAAVMAYGSDSEYESDSSSSSSSSSSESSDSSPTQDRSPPQEEPSHHTEGQTSSIDLQGQIRARLQQSSLAPEVAQQILTILEGDPSLSEISVPLEDPSSGYGAPGDYVPVYLYPAIQPPHTPSPRRRRRADPSSRARSDHKRARHQEAEQPRKRRRISTDLTEDNVYEVLESLESFSAAAPSKITPQEARQVTSMLDLLSSTLNEVNARHQSATSRQRFRPPQEKGTTSKPVKRVSFASETE